MARYLLIEFDEDAQAETLRAQIDAATRKGKKFRVVGLFARPGRKVCQCIKTKDDYKGNRLVRGSKFGWWICQSCRRPRLGRQDLRNLLSPKEVLDQPVFDAIDMLAVQPLRNSYQMHVGELTIWPEIRRDIAPAGVEDAPAVGQPHENGVHLPFGRKR